MLTKFYKLEGLQTAFKAGSVMGFYVVGCGLLGLSLIFWINTLGTNLYTNMPTLYSVYRDAHKI